jgi:hypothetical protein
VFDHRLLPARKQVERQEQHKKDKHELKRTVYGVSPNRWDSGRHIHRSSRHGIGSPVAAIGVPDHRVRCWRARGSLLNPGSAVASEVRVSSEALDWRTIVEAGLNPKPGILSPERATSRSINPQHSLFSVMPGCNA